MDKTDYINSLKTTDLRPKKIKPENIAKEQILLEQDDQVGNQIKKSILEWFMKNPYPKDDDVHAFADEMGINAHEFENHIYAILSSLLSEGNSKGKNNNYDQTQIDMGIKVEMEHTTCPIISEKIVWDHLAEIPDYYTRLAKIENEAGVNHEDE